MNVDARFGKAIQYYVDKSEFSQNEIALYSGLGSSTKLRRIMNGKSTMTVKGINAFCHTMNITTVELFTKVEEM